MRNLTSV